MSDVDLFGTADAVAVFPDRVVIVDFKFGRGEIDTSTVYWQALAYAHMAMQKYDRPEASVHVLKARGEIEFFHVFQRGDGGLEALDYVLRRAYAPDAVRTPSDAACRYCRAKAICPEFPATVAESAVVQVPAAEITTERLREALDVAYKLEPWCSAVKAAAKDLLMVGGKLDGYELREQRRREVASIDAAWELIRDTVPQDSFIHACNVKVAALEKAFLLALKEQGKYTAAEARQIFNMRLAPAMATKTVTILTRKGDSHE